MLSMVVDLTQGCTVIQNATMAYGIIFHHLHKQPPFWRQTNQYVCLPCFGVRAFSRLIQIVFTIRFCIKAMCDSYCTLNDSK